MTMFITGQVAPSIHIEYRPPAWPVPPHRFPVAQVPSSFILVAVLMKDTPVLLWTHTISLAAGLLPGMVSISAAGVEAILPHPAAFLSESQTPVYILEVRLYWFKLADEANLQLQPSWVPGHLKVNSAVIPVGQVAPAWTNCTSVMISSCLILGQRGVILTSWR